jgi:hypothetical protein
MYLTFKSLYTTNQRMPSYLISPPAVQRIAPASKPLGTAPTHVSVSAVHGSTSKPVTAASGSTFTAATLASSAPTHIVSQSRTYLYQQ